MRESFKSKKEQSKVNWKSVILENRQMMLKEGLAVSELELLWEYAMLFGSKSKSLLINCFNL
jgi:hypothetical protein